MDGSTTVLVDGSPETLEGSSTRSETTEGINAGATDGPEPSGCRDEESSSIRGEMEGLTAGGRVAVEGDGTEESREAGELERVDAGGFVTAE